MCRLRGPPWGVPVARDTGIDGAGALRLRQHPPLLLMRSSAPSLRHRPVALGSRREGAGLRPCLASPGASLRPLRVSPRPKPEDSRGTAPQVTASSWWGCSGGWAESTSGSAHRCRRNGRWRFTPPENRDPSAVAWAAAAPLRALRSSAPSWRQTKQPVSRDPAGGWAAGSGPQRGRRNPPG